MAGKPKEIRRCRQFTEDDEEFFGKVIRLVEEGSLPKRTAKELAARLKPAERVQRLVAQLPWAHNVLLMQKVKHLPTRCWYMMAVIQEGRSRDMLAVMIKSSAHARQHHWLELDNNPSESYVAAYDEPKVVFNETSKCLHAYLDTDGNAINKTGFIILSPDEIAHIEGALANTRGVRGAEDEADDEG